MRTNRYWMLAAGALTLLLTGCSSAPNVLPDRGEDIKTVYGKHIAGEIHANSAASQNTEQSDPQQTVSPIQIQHQRSLGNQDVNIEGFVRDQKKEIESLFPLLPNPQLVMFVFPHLSPKGHPVPGYSVPFRFYAKDEYAMPGEIKH